MDDAVVLEHAAERDRPSRRVAAVAVDQQRCVVAECCAHRRDNRLGAAGPFVLVAADLLADAELEGVVAVRVAQPGETRGLVLGRDVAAHARGIDPERPRRAAQEFADALALEPAAQVPQRGVEPANRAAQVRARKLVLALGDQIDQRVDVGGVGAQRVGRDLAVHHDRRDVREIGRNLAPALGPVVRRDADEADVLGAERLDSGDFHDAPSGTPSTVMRCIRRRSPP